MNQSIESQNLTFFFIFFLLISFGKNTYRHIKLIICILYHRSILRATSVNIRPLRRWLSILKLTTSKQSYWGSFKEISIFPFRNMDRLTGNRWCVKRILFRGCGTPNRSLPRITGVMLVQSLRDCISYYENDYEVISDHFIKLWIKHK